MELHHCHVSAAAKERALECLDDGHLSEGLRVHLFEHRLYERLGLVNPVAVNSGTSALHLALVLAGVGSGDEVILPAQTFIATGMAVLMCGAKPVFADIDPETGNISVSSVAEKLSERTKAIIPVHWAGLPCDINELNLIIGYDWSGLLIEDAAHALGATYKGKPIGSISQFTCFSFQAIKHLTTGDGGALCCLSSNDYTDARRRRWFDLYREDPVNELGERPRFAIDVGFKYHMNNLAASIGLGNLDTFPQRLKRRQDINQRYREELKSVPGFQLLRHDSDRTSACWTFSVLVDQRLSFVRAMKSRWVPTGIINSRIDKHPVFNQPNNELPGQAMWDAKHIALPCHEGLTGDEVTQVIKAVKGGW